MGEGEKGRKGEGEKGRRGERVKGRKGDYLISGLVSFSAKNK